MAEDKYQITKKAHYLNLILLKDELQQFNGVFSGVISDVDEWLVKLRATRSVFLTLNNVKDAADRIHINNNNNFLIKTRNLKKTLTFANHFRNRGIGHLDDTLLKRAAQWSPQLFYENLKNNETFQLIEAQRTIIESCINSFIDKNGVQKIFGTEIDLMHPPNAEEFFTYLSKTVEEAIIWLSEASSIIISSIDLHTDEEILELAAIAGQTKFDLNAPSDFYFSSEKIKANLSEATLVLEQDGASPEMLELLRERVKNITSHSSESGAKAPSALKPKLF